MRAMSAPCAPEFSLLATHHPSTCSSLLAMGTQALRERWMPSTKTARHASPVNGGSGQTRQNSCVRPLNVLPPPGMPACLPLESRQPRNSSSLLAKLSILSTRLAPKALNLHRMLPALVVPFRFILPPHEGHLTTFIPSSRRRPTFRLETTCSSRANAGNRTHILSTLKVVGDQL